MKRLAVLLLLTGCQYAPHQLDLGEVVRAPIQCHEYQRSGGYCSLQFALDEVHARFTYQADHVAHPELNSFAGVDKWQQLPADGRGDCEDFALTLRQYLNDRGITGTRLLTVYVKDQGYHVALELDGWVMDNTHRFPVKLQHLWDWDIQTAGDEAGVWRKVYGLYILES